MTNPDVCVVGLGYIGLPTAAIFAHKGLTVHGVDVNPRTVEAVNSGRVPFVEPDLGGYVERAVADGKLTAATEAVPAATFIIAVPTPFHDDHSADLSYIEAATRGVAKHLSGDELLILESTSPPGATQRMADVVYEERPDLVGSGLKFAHCPERVLPGRVMVELVTNDRIVGGITPEAAEAARDLYRVFCEGEILLTDAITAEMAKLVENSFRDVNIAFANELSIICERLGIDVWELIELANHHPRVNILQPGPGVGGHCIAVDPWFIVSAAPAESRLIRMARDVNDGKPHWVMDRIREATEGIAEPTVAMLGLAFKPNIDDLRESPALAIVRDYAADHPESRVLAVEPHIEELPAKLANLVNVTLAETEEALQAADVIVVLVDHAAFKAIPAHRVEGKQIVDSKGLWR
ncbi:UDP-N-acetyl-D-mannosamine dehydrogenase [Tessaracoccus sp. OS52]|uniref:UDP-N-acetyl-D-mannosamine dehydrogenase n=1 Tax=Tessaracoccus sp. OS52 TaxID=2886691 RepID=UPI001D0F5995|nr:UDP-N-acetyl-D-mannosamine dehydrogenase [Tessaracoccus sp. OS52]